LKRKFREKYLDPRERKEQDIREGYDILFGWSTQGGWDGRDL